uniref:GON domain-containing protein n=1 Tax=Ascaris lumbricoides TaxID=6252 RepID=A0A0M3I3X6_ASCLU
MGGCGGGCGRCCARAKGSKTFSASGIVRGGGSLERRLDPNERFFECCKEQQLPPSCLNKCSYSNYNQVTIRNMFFGLDACPIQAANTIHFCATRGVDHQHCCARNGVTTTLAGSKCLIFCAPVNVYFEARIVMLKIHR